MESKNRFGIGPKRVGVVLEVVPKLKDKLKLQAAMKGTLPPGLRVTEKSELQ